jgi:hypothetical protein
LSLAASPCITRGRRGWLGLTPWKTCTSYPFASFLGALRSGSGTHEIEGDDDRYLKIASAPLWLGGKWVDGNLYSRHGGARLQYLIENPSLTSTDQRRRRSTTSMISEPMCLSILSTCVRTLNDTLRTASASPGARSRGRTLTKKHSLRRINHSLTVGPQP